MRTEVRLGCWLLELTMSFCKPSWTRNFNFKQGDGAALSTMRALTQISGKSSCHSYTLMLIIQELPVRNLMFDVFLAHAPR
jgi:hypothetical protein